MKLPRLPWPQRPGHRALPEGDDAAGLLRAKHDALARLTEANTLALELLADLQQKAAGEFLFDTKYLRDTSTRVLALGTQVIAELERLAGTQQRRLAATLEALRQRAGEQIGDAPPVPRGPAALPLSRMAGADPLLVGEKVRRLSTIREELGLPAPDGFAVTTAGCHHLLEQRGLWESIRKVVGGLSLIDRARLAAASAEIKARIASTPWPGALAEEVLREFDELRARAGDARLRVSVRSSAVGEDAWFSFAGQYASVLNVDREGLLDACKEVLASQFGPRAVVYYKARGLDASLLPMSIGILAMVDARAGGVLYTRSPTNRDDDRMIVSGVWGLGPLAVEGAIAPDVFAVSRAAGHELLSVKLAVKPRMLLCGDGPGLVQVAVPGWMRAKPCLTRDQLSELGSYGMRLEERFGGPQDVEWVAGPSETIQVLQARPLRLPAPSADAAGDPAGARASLPPPVAHGVVGSRGLAAGIVVFVAPGEETAQVPAGAVVAARTARPELAAVLDGASALVVEGGSAASHLATIAREMRIPALFDLQDGLARLPPGLQVTVDAEMGSVYAGRQESLLRIAAGRERDAAAAETPLFAKLRALNALLVPLNLTDPRARQFRPSGCRTLHDILRYAHETAIREMFEAASSVTASTGRSRRLASALPLDFYLIDLGGALEADGTGPVAAEQLRSRPLLALWSGMTSVPWDTRPAVPPASLGALLAGGMTGRAGGPGAPEANYILASGNYVNLHASFGYHFSRVDAFLGDREQGNYASLLFHGGAADVRRRERRLDMIDRVLRPRQWRVSRRGDVLFARIEELAPSSLAAELRALGRLLMVTRQADALLGDEADVERAVAAYERGEDSLGLQPAPGGRR